MMPMEATVVLGEYGQDLKPHNAPGLQDCKSEGSYAPITTLTIPGCTYGSDAVEIRLI